MWLKQLTFSAPLRYLAVAGCGFTVDFLIYAALVASGASVYWANFAGFCIGAVVNVLLIRRFVFTNSRFSLTKDILLTFMANGGMLIFGTVLLWLLVVIVSANPYGAKLAVNGITFVMNYATRAIFFRRR